MAITLHYFDLYARGEVTRMIMHYQGAEFTDHRIAFEEWPALRESGFSEFSELPVLEIDGLRLVQSHSINRFLCQKFGLLPASPIEEYYAESLCDLKEDIYRHFAQLTFAKDHEAIEKEMNESMPVWLKMIEKRLEKNKQGNGWFVGENVTIADFEVFQLVHDYILREGPSEKYSHLVDTNAPKLKAWATRLIESSQTLKSYLATRGNCFF